MEDITDRLTARLSGPQLSSRRTMRRGIPDSTEPSVGGHAAPINANLPCRSGRARLPPHRSLLRPHIARPQIGSIKRLCNSGRTTQEAELLIPCLLHMAPGGGRFDPSHWTSLRRELTGEIEDGDVRVIRTLADRHADQLCTRLQQIDAILQSGVDVVDQHGCHLASCRHR